MTPRRRLTPAPGPTELTELPMGDDRDVRLIAGGVHADVPGTVSFFNDFDFDGVDRFYTIRARHQGEPRGWVGHRRDHKWFTVLHGSVLLSVVKPDMWEQPSAALPVQHFVLSADDPSVLCVPAGHATASTGLTDDAVLLIFSSGRIEHAKEDDYRFPIDLWPATAEQ